jgi:Tol biopolymer transport system component
MMVERCGLTVLMLTVVACALAGLVNQPALTPADRPVVQIVSPSDGSKLRQGRTMDVRVHVEPGARPLAHWALRLSGYLGERELASGGQVVTGRVVAQLAADTLVPGETYRLTLTAQDADEATGIAQVRFLVPDPQYTLGPLEPGNLSRTFFYGLSLDGSGNLVAQGGNRFGDVLLVNTADNTRQVLRPGEPEEFHLSADGQRLIFGGSGLDSHRGLNIAELATGAVRPGPRTDAFLFFTTDAAGRRIAFQSNFDLDPRVGNPDGTLQYFLYDDETKEIRQLTNDPDAIVYGSDCPSSDGTTPAISEDSTTVVFASKSSLDLAPPDTRAGAGCYLIAYDVPTATARLLRTFEPTDAFIGAPVISADGRLVSFTPTRLFPDGTALSIGVLLDLQTGRAVEPIAETMGSFPTFDASVSGDGSIVIISSQADLDPRVGNADHHMDLFAYDVQTGRFTQVSETVGGIGPFSGICERYNPQVSSDGRAVAFRFMVLSVELCRLDGPQRNEVDGFVFGAVRAIRKRPGDHGPVFDPDTHPRVVAGKTMQLEFDASDPDGDPITFFAQELNGTDVPPGSVIEDRHDGTASFTWATRPEQVGTHTLRVAAFDEGGGEVYHDLQLAVCSRIVNDGDLTGVVGALFQSDPPPACHDADRNRDGLVSAADLVAARADG